MAVKLNSSSIYLATLFLSLGLIFSQNSFAKAKSSARTESCLKLGQGDTQSGVPSNENKLPSPCCKPLKDREPMDICGIPSGGGYQYVCLACGDGKCDPELENTCNCHEDCK